MVPSGFKRFGHLTVFKKVTSTEKVLISVKNWIFDDTFYKKGPVLVILVPGMIQPSGSVIFVMK